MTPTHTSEQTAGLSALSMLWFCMLFMVITPLIVVMSLHSPDAPPVQQSPVSVSCEVYGGTATTVYNTHPTVAHYIGKRNGEELQRVAVPAGEGAGVTFCALDDLAWQLVPMR